MSEPIKLGPDTSWGSHIVPLMACVCATRGAILEVGCGHWSTPLLHRYAVAANRRLLTIDEDKEYLHQFNALVVCRHQVQYMDYSVELPKLAKEQWSVVLLDHSPGWRRGADALLFKDSAELIISHDYSGEEVWRSFEAFLCEWPYKAKAEFSPSSLILGNMPIPDFDKKVVI